MPHSDKPALGVELEVEFKDSQSLARAAAMGAEYDASLNCGAEFKLCSPWPSVVKRVLRLAGELRERGARVSSRCGLHVHMDMRSVSLDRASAFLRWARYTQESWFKLVPQSRRGSHYVSRLAYGDSHTEWVNIRYASSRAASRLMPLSTLECRLHPGTLNPHKLEAWLAVMHYTMTRIRDVEYQWDMVSMDPSLAFDRFVESMPPLARDYCQARKASQGVLCSPFATVDSYNPQEED